MKVRKVETTLDVSYLELARNMLKSNSRAMCFYIHLVNMHICNKLSSQNNLISRASRACDKYDISFIKYMYIYICLMIYMLSLVSGKSKSSKLMMA